jgi:hypothetical protein
MELSGVDAREGESSAHGTGQGVAVVGGAGSELETAIEAPAVRSAVSEETAGVSEAARDHAEHTGRYGSEAVGAGHEQECRCDERFGSHAGDLP